jgi:hypothetical protein
VLDPSSGLLAIDAAPFQLYSFFRKTANTSMADLRRGAHVLLQALYGHHAERQIGVSSQLPSANF